MPKEVCEPLTKTDQFAGWCRPHHAVFGRRQLSEMRLSDRSRRPIAQMSDAGFTVNQISATFNVCRQTAASWLKAPNIWADQDMHVLRHQIPCQNPPLFLRSQILRQLHHMPHEFLIKAFFSCIWVSKPQGAYIPILYALNFLTDSSGFLNLLNFRRFPDWEAFDDSRNCQTLGVPRQSRGHP
ncbi:MAG: hypothetical protein CTY16_00260 [Methylobacter sp.]|nr:MAG: hypothetical protein CTY16_00260 [Methylobacter sp.]